MNRKPLGTDTSFQLRTLEILRDTDIIFLVVSGALIVIDDLYRENKWPTLALSNSLDVDKKKYLK